MKTLMLVLAALAGASQAGAADRFPVPKPEQLTPDQAKFVEGLMSGPRGGGSSGPEAVARMLQRGPFNAWLRSPALGERLQKVGEYIRFETSLPLRLNEFAILITARCSSSARRASEIVQPQGIHRCSFDFAGDQHRSDYLALGLLKLGATANPLLQAVLDPLAAGHNA